MGTYAGVKFSTQTEDEIESFMEANKIPNPTPRNELHTTLLYSRKHLPKYAAAGKYKPPMIGKPVKFDYWETRESKKMCLVVEYSCKMLYSRHQELMNLHKATYDFDEYIPHVTLSYDCGSFRLAEDVFGTFPRLEIVREYSEQLQF